MEKISWIKDLVVAEQQMEDTGMVDMTAGFDPAGELESATADFMQDMKAAFIEAASTFNQLKGSAVGTIKIYGIAKTQADFMLFRNGHKLIFSLHQPGAITISFNSAASHFVPGQNASDGMIPGVADILKAQWGAYGELKWTSNDLEVNLDYLVRYYLVRFVKESAK